MDAIKTYSVPMIVAIVVLGIVQLFKSDKIPLTIPPRAQPFVAIALALVGAIATRVIQGADVGTAVIEGFGAGLTSIGLFEAGKNAKGPSDPPPPPAGGSSASGSSLPTDDPFRAGGAMRVVFGAVFALVAFGCGAAQQVEHVVQISSEIIARAEPCLMAQYEAAQKQCLELPTDAERRGCVADARLMWKPIIDGLGELREVRCGLEPQKCEAKE